MPRQNGPGESPDGSGAAGKIKTVSEQLVDLTLARATLFATPDEKTWASIEVSGHAEVRAIASTAFKQWLIHQYYVVTQKAPKPDSLTQAVLTLEAKARYEGGQGTVFLRTGKQGDALYLDLADEEWRSVEVTAAGWKVQSSPKLYFQRRRGMLPIQAPEAGGHLNELRGFLNISSDDDFLLIVAWLLSALSPTGPFPILALAGEPGAAKSTTARLLRSLIDPNISPLRAPPKDERDCWIAASNAAIVTLDNLAHIPGWLSDTLCRIATGGGFATRQLQTDDGEVVFDISRPIILTAIGDVIANSDLADRALMIELPVIPDRERRHEAAMNAAFAEAKPRILGALLDAVAYGLRHQRDVRLDNLPRLADFAVWISACEGAYTTPGATMAAFAANVSDAAETVLQNNAVCVALMAFMEANSGYWRGKPAALFTSLRTWAPDGTIRERSWPKNPQTLSNSLRLAMPSLRKRNIFIVKGKSNGQRYIEVSCK